MRTIIKKAALLLAAGTMACASLFAQEMHSLSFRRTVKSPEITEQGITFRFNAPKARQVQVYSGRVHRGDRFRLPGDLGH